MSEDRLREDGRAMTGPRVLGLDLSLSATGVAMPADDGTGELAGVPWFTIKAKSADGDRRLVQIGGAVRRAVEVGVPDFVVIEDMQARTIGNGMLTHLVHGVVRRDLTELGVPYVLVPSTTLKAFACFGNADKSDMKIAAYKLAGVEFADDNQCDAWWLRVAGLDAVGHPLYRLPGEQRAKLHPKVRKGPRKGEPSIAWSTVTKENES